MPRPGMKRSASNARDSSDSESGAPVAKKPKSASSGPSKDSDGNRFWEISKSRRVTISDFKGKTFVNIREYYEKDGKTLPGKKGISLTTEQYQELLRFVPAINAEIKKKTGQGVDDVDEPAPAAGRKASNKSNKTKSNIEATSDEDEE